jgi:hypothetical protein
MLMSQTDSNSHKAIDDFISIARAVRYSGYSEQYLRRKARDGEIHALKFGFFWMIERASLEAYVERARDKNVADKRFGPRDFE